MPPPRILTELPEPALERGTRFEPAGFTFSRGRFGPDEIAALEGLYACLEDLYQAWLADDRRRPEVVRDHLGERLVARVHAFTNALRNGSGASAPALRELRHDLRGGGLTALVGVTHLLDEGVLGGGEEAREHLQLAVWFARDHAKMMRMALPWLDPERAAVDATERPHGVDDLVRKWQGAHMKVADAEATLRVHARLPGALASRCIEAAALDRVSYNLLNNAVRFTADDAVEMHLDDVSGELGRVAVVNVVGDEERPWLAATLAEDPRALFRAGVTRGGEGDGLASVARIVSSVFGLSPLEAVERHMVGTRMSGDRFVAWFHWPRVQPEATTHDGRSP
jgi:hypothetical protein